MPPPGPKNNSSVRAFDEEDNVAQSVEETQPDSHTRTTQEPCNPTGEILIPEENVRVPVQEKYRRTEEERQGAASPVQGDWGIHAAHTLLTVTPPFTSESFTIHKKLGEGSFGKVYLASHISSGKEVALKMVNKLKSLEEDIYREEDILKKTSISRFVSHLYGTFQTPVYACFVLEYLSGGTLSDFIKKDKNPLSINTTRFLAAEIICGLDFLHSRDIVHGDLKTENILLDSVGHAKIADFGLAETILYGRNKISGYMVREITLSSFMNDWYWFGVIFYEMVVGTHPFKYPDYNPQYPKTLNPDVKDILRRLLSKSHEKRREVSQNLRKYEFFKTIKWEDLEAGKIYPPYNVPMPLSKNSEGIPMDDFIL